MVGVQFDIRRDLISGARNIEDIQRSSGVGTGTFIDLFDTAGCRTIYFCSKRNTE